MGKDVTEPGNWKAQIKPYESASLPDKLAPLPEIEGRCQWMLKKIVDKKFTIEAAYIWMDNGQHVLRVDFADGRRVTVIIRWASDSTAYWRRLSKRIIAAHGKVKRQKIEKIETVIQKRLL